MAERYYLCEMVGDGNIDAPEPWGRDDGPYRPALSDIDKRGVDGGVLHEMDFVGEAGTFALVRIDSGDFAAVEAYQGPNGDYGVPEFLFSEDPSELLKQSDRVRLRNTYRQRLGITNAEATALLDATLSYAGVEQTIAEFIKPGVVTKLKTRPRNA